MTVPRLTYLWNYLYHWSAVMPEAIALHYNEETLTYAALERQVNQVATSFQKAGLQKKDRVVTILPSTPEFLVVYLAASQLGAIVIPFDVRYRISDLERFLDRSSPQLIVAAAATKENHIAGHLAKLVQVESIPCYYTGTAGFGKAYAELLQGEGKVSPEMLQSRAALDEEDGNLVIFTGGTTGVPKGALLSNKNVCAMAFHEEAFLRGELRRAGYKGRISTLAALPPSHVGGAIECMGQGLLGGHELYFLENWNPTTVLELSAAARIPWIGGVPTMYALMLSLADIGRYDLSGIFLALLSGEQVTGELLAGIKEKICSRVINGYGSTEAGAELTFTRPEDPPEKLAEGYVGLPLPTVSIKIVDANNNVLLPGQTGEVVIQSDFTIRQYFQSPEEDEAGFTADGFCRTGDLGFLDPDGGLYLRGRIKHIIRVGSYTVMPSEVEEVALQMPEVAMAAALGAPHPIYGEEVWLFIVFKPGQSLPEESLIDYMKSRLADYKAPRRVFVRSSIPTTRIGKADRISLLHEIEAAGWVC